MALRLGFDLALDLVLGLALTLDFVADLVVDLGSGLVFAIPPVLLGVVLTPAVAFFLGAAVLPVCAFGLETALCA